MRVGFAIASSENGLLRPSPDERSAGHVAALCRSLVDKVSDKVLTLCARHAWQIAKVHRWANVGSVCHRFAMLAAEGNILIKSLRVVNTHLGVSEDLEASL